jgi:FAD/FMN-containing dehydrogenase
LERELGTATVALQRRVKDALDPLGILNPGKAV